MLNLPAAAVIFSITSSKSKLVAFEKRMGLMRAATNGREIRTRQAARFQLLDDRRHPVVERQNEARPPLTLGD